MKLARFDDDRTGVLLGDGSDAVLLDLAASLPALAEALPDEHAAVAPALAGEGPLSWLGLVEGWDDLRAPFAALVAWATEHPESVVTKPLDAVTLRPPLPSPTTRLFALGTNFAMHVTQGMEALGIKPGELPRPTTPGGFYVIPGTIIGPGEPFTPPPGAEKMDLEVEAAVVIATGGDAVDAADVRIWGYTGFNDLSVRDPHLGVGLATLDKGALAWGLQKNWQGGNALGVFMVVDEGADVAALKIESRVNGEVRQSGSTADMIFGFADSAAYLSSFLTLQVGDMFTSGTPSGTAIESGPDGPFLRDGDEVAVEVGDAGALVNHMRAR